MDKLTKPVRARGSLLVLSGMGLRCREAQVRRAAGAAAPFPHGARRENLQQEGEGTEDGREEEQQDGGFDPCGLMPEGEASFEVGRRKGQQGYVVQRDDFAGGRFRQEEVAHETHGHAHTFTEIGDVLHLFVLGAEWQSDINHIDHLVDEEVFEFADWSEIGDGEVGEEVFPFLLVIEEARDMEGRSVRETG